MALHPVTLCIKTTYFAPRGASLRDDANVFERIEAARIDAPLARQPLWAPFADDHASKRYFVPPMPVSKESMSVSLYLGTERIVRGLKGPWDRHVPDYPRLIERENLLQCIRGVALTGFTPSCAATFKAFAAVSYLATTSAVAIIAVALCIAQLVSLLGLVHVVLGATILGALFFGFFAEKQLQQNKAPNEGPKGHGNTLLLTAQGAMLGFYAALLATGLAMATVYTLAALSAWTVSGCIVAMGAALGAVVGIKEWQSYAKAHQLFNDLKNLCLVVDAHHRMPNGSKHATSRLNPPPDRAVLGRAQNELLTRAQKSRSKIVRQAAKDAAALLAHAPGTSGRRPVVPPPVPSRVPGLFLA